LPFREFHGIVLTTTQGDRDVGFRLRAGILLLAALGAPQARAEEPSGVSVALSLPSKSLKAGERVTVPVWLTNPSPDPLGVEVELAGPGAAHLLSRSACVTPPEGDAGWRGLRNWREPDSCKEGPNARWGPIAPGKALRADLCLCLSHEVQEEDSSLLFVFRSFKPTGAVSVTTVGREVELGLFGPQSVGGISLRLMSLFVPGYLFLWLFQLVWGDTVVTGIERGVGAVLISAVLLTGSYWLSPPGLPGAISMWRLFGLLGTAAGLAGFAGFGLRRLGQWLLVQSTDSNETAMMKLLRLRKANERLKSVRLVYDLTIDNPKVLLADEKVICGCLMGRIPRGWVILPELRIITKANPVRQQLYARSGQWAELLRYAHEQGITIGSGPLQEREKRGIPFQPWELPRYHATTQDVLSYESRKGVEWAPIVIEG
jgi:hypothetical protein